jgi:hypothetical protein
MEKRLKDNETWTNEVYQDNEWLWL